MHGVVCFCHLLDEGAGKQLTLFVLESINNQLVCKLKHNPNGPNHSPPWQEALKTQLTSKAARETPPDPHHRACGNQRSRHSCEEQVVFPARKPLSGRFCFYFRVNVTWLILRRHLRARITCHGCQAKLQFCTEKRNMSNAEAMEKKKSLSFDSLLWQERPLCNLRGGFRSSAICLRRRLCPDLQPRNRNTTHMHGKSWGQGYYS